MLERHDHEVAARIRVDVKDDVIEFGAVQDKGLFIIITRGERTEDAGAAAALFSACALDVIIPPGSVKPVHICTRNPPRQLAALDERRRLASAPVLFTVSRRAETRRPARFV